MPSILIVAHAPLASSLLSVAQHVYPECARLVAAVDVPPDATLAAAQAEVRSAIERLHAPEVLILVDVFGATPCTAARSACQGPRTRVVAGVNVPMLWRTLCYADDSLDELVERAVAGATMGVVQVSAAPQQNQPQTLVPHDHVTNQHQQ